MINLSPRLQRVLIVNEIFLFVDFSILFCHKFRQPDFFWGVNWTIRTVAQIVIALTHRTEVKWEDRGKQEDIYYGYDGLPGLNCKSENPN